MSTTNSKTVASYNANATWLQIVAKKNGGNV